MAGEAPHSRAIFHFHRVFVKNLPNNKLASKSWDSRLPSGKSWNGHWLNSIHPSNNFFTDAKSLKNVSGILKV